MAFPTNKALVVVSLSFFGWILFTSKSRWKGFPNLTCGVAQPPTRQHLDNFQDFLVRSNLPKDAKHNSL